VIFWLYAKLPGYGTGYGSTNFLKSQDLDTTNKTNINIIFIIIKKNLYKNIKIINFVIYNLYIYI
jgi:hypothetical protein